MPIGKISTKRSRYPAACLTVSEEFLTEIRRKTGAEEPRFIPEFQEPDLVHLKFDPRGGKFAKDGALASRQFTLQASGPIAKAIIDKFGLFGRVETEFVWVDRDLILHVPANRPALGTRNRAGKTPPAAKNAPERAAVPEPPESPQPALGRPKRDLDPASAGWITAAIGDAISPADVRAVKRAIDYVERHTPYQLKKRAADGAWVFDAERIE